MPTITLHRYAPPLMAGPSDLTSDDLTILWGLMKAEGLPEIFFHDGTVRTLADFTAYATTPDNWFYAARRDGVFIGFGVVNNFTTAGNTAFAHLCSFACGRDGSFAEAGRLWFRLLHEHGGLDTILAVFPGLYRGVRRWVQSFGFRETAVLPGALRLTRGRVSDACVYVKDLREAAEQPAQEARKTELPR